ncbi:MAG TPA: malate synthase A [Acidimicrobiales bacterium]|nr:malate synthase A [Acidimicrobiales bacterium]
MAADERIECAPHELAGELLTVPALEFVARLHRAFERRRRLLLDARTGRQRRLNAGELPDFPRPGGVRERQWTVAPVPKDLADRRVEITGPADRKMMINALNSGAQAFMVDFEDSLAPTWDNVVGGQRNLHDAVRGTISFDGADGRRYDLADETATLLVRPRGWHLVERHLRVDGQPVSASLFDFGLAFFHNARALLDAGSGPYFYLPKLENSAEAALWNDVFLFAQDDLGLEPGTIKATVLLETVLAAFEMDEILYELREHSAGLNAGRWDYIFSVIKKFRAWPDFVLPDRSQVTMAVPFMRAYTELLVQTCHRRGAHAIGGMAAFVPNRRDPEVTASALARVRDDKRRESADGFDGTWVAHPDLVPVALDVFDGVLGERANQLDRLRDDVEVGAGDLLAVATTGGAVSESGVRADVSVGIRYLESWLRGTGAAAIDNLMEDAATAEICRAQIWQWRRHGVTLDDGRRLTPELVAEIAGDEVARLRATLGPATFDTGRFPDARRLFARVAGGEGFDDFLTLPAYEYLD